MSRCVARWCLGCSVSMTLIISLCAVAAAEPPDDRVDSLCVSADGEYTLDFVYWVGADLFPHELYSPAEFVILGEVVDVGPASSSVYRDDLSPRVRGEVATGRLRVQRVLRCPARLREQASHIRFLVSDAMVGLGAEDRVMVFMIPFEGRYATLNWSASNCDLGFKLWHWSAEDESRLADLFSSGRAWEPERLSYDELRLWARLEPESVALWAIDKLEAREQGND